MTLIFTCNFIANPVHDVSNKYARIRSLLPSLIYNALENWRAIKIYSYLVLLLLNKVLDSPQFVYKKIDYTYQYVIWYAKFYHWVMTYESIYIVPCMINNYIQLRLSFVFTHLTNHINTQVLTYQLLLVCLGNNQKLRHPPYNSSGSPTKALRLTPSFFQ